jgi:Flp pilus assembly pilin Flp
VATGKTEVQMISTAIETLLIGAPAALERDRGQAFVEYVLLLSIVALAAAVTYSLFAGDLANALTAIESRLLGS